HQALSAQIAFAARDLPAAVDLAKQAIAIDPEFWIGHFQLGQAYEQLDKPELALEALNHAGRLSNGNSKSIAVRGYILAKQGKTEEARELLNTLETVARNRYVPPYAHALVYAGLGERAIALECLERSHEARDIHLAFLTYDP